MPRPANKPDDKTSISTKPTKRQAGKQAKKSASQRGKNVRVSDELYALADECSEIAQRSVQKQIEYWSQLGYLFEMSLSNADSYALLSREKFISKVMLSSNQLPSPDEIMDAMERDRSAGTLASFVSEANVVYDLAEDGKSIRQTDANNKVTVGSFVDGKFVESPE